MPLSPALETRNLPSMEIFIDAEELPLATSTLANTDSEEVSVRQANSAAPLLGDSRTDYSSMIRHLIRVELHRGLGHRCRRSEREDSGPLPHCRKTLTHLVRLR